jgi:hypothetical protein
VYERYYYGCAPVRCIISTLEAPDFAGIAIMMVGLAGGLLAAGRIFGKSILMLCRFTLKCISRQTNVTKVEPQNKE